MTVVTASSAENLCDSQHATVHGTSERDHRRKSPGVGLSTNTTLCKAKAKTERTPTEEKLLLC